MKVDAEAVIVAVPNCAPVTAGCVAGDVEPAGMRTDEVTVATALELLNETVVPPAGAGEVNEIGNGTDWPGEVLMLAGTLMPPLLPAEPTVTLAVAAVTPAAEAVIWAVPELPPVTPTTTPLEPAEIVTLDATAATPALLEVRLTVSGAGADTDRFRVSDP